MGGQLLSLKLGFDGGDHRFSEHVRRALSCVSPYFASWRVKGGPPPAPLSAAVSFPTGLSPMISSEAAERALFAKRAFVVSTPGGGTEMTTITTRRQTQPDQGITVCQRQPLKLSHMICTQAGSCEGVLE